MSDRTKPPPGYNVHAFNGRWGVETEIYKEEQVEGVTVRNIYCVTRRARLSLRGDLWAKEASAIAAAWRHHDAMKREEAYARQQDW